MLGISQHDFRAIQLDPDLLTTPFRTQTNWQVITGAPSSGITTLINQLAHKGFQTVPESARLYLEREMASGRTIDEIRENEAGQRGIEDMQLRIEGELRATDLLFLDRALPDCLAFRRARGLNPNEMLPKCFHHRYAYIFVLDRFSVQQDGLRTQDDALAGLIGEWLARDYRALGYSFVRVPALSPQERLAYVLDRLSEQGLI
jgi:predicted ATPase